MSICALAAAGGIAGRVGSASADRGRGGWSKWDDMKHIINDQVVLSRPLEGPLAAHIGLFANWTRG